MHQTTSSVVLLFFPPCPSAPGCDTFYSQPLHLHLLLPPPRMMLQRCHPCTSLLLLNDVNPHFPFSPSPSLSYHRYPPLSLLWGDRVTSSLEGINCQRRTKREITHFILPCCPVKKRASLLQEGLEARLCTCSLTFTLICTHTADPSFFLPHSHTQRRGRTGSQARVRCRLPLAWESLMRSSLQAEAHVAISKALCWG